MNYYNPNNALIGDIGLQCNNNNVQVLYTKVQRVYVKSELKEERQTELKVNVEIHAGVSPVCRKSLCVKLFDDNDPCFLYSLFINEEDFKILKSQQGLLVDFENFATQLINLLEQCQVPASLNIPKTQKFLLLLTEEKGSWSFKLVETNNFKHLCHLSLVISPANDTEIKSHMAIKIKQLKEYTVQKERDITHLETRVKDLMEMLEIKSRDLEHLEQKYMTEKTQFHMNLQQQTNMEHERLNQARMEWQHETEKERMKTDQIHKETLKEIRGEVSDLRLENGTLKEKIVIHESKSAEQKKQIQTLEQDLTITQRELSQIRKQNSKLDVDYHDKDKALNALRTRVAVVEQELKDKTILITKHTEMLNDAKEQKQHLEDLLAEKEYQLQRKQTSIKGLSDELMKANEILSKLQNELSSTKSKLKLRTSIALEQEKLLDAKQKELGQMQIKMETNIKSYQDMKSEMEIAKERLKELQTQLEKKEEIIKNNENVISWLNRRLTENQSLHGVSITRPPLSSLQMGIQRANKYLNTPSNNYLQQTNPADYLSKTNPYLNIDQTSRLKTSSLPTNNLATNGTLNLHSNGLISSTSTPLDRMTVLNNKHSENANPAITKVPIVNENNNINPAAKNVNTGIKFKTTSSMQGGLRRAGNGRNLPSSNSSRMKH